MTAPALSFDTQLDSLLMSAAGAPVHGRTGTVLKAGSDMATVAGINLAERELALVESTTGQPLVAERSGVDGPRSYLALLDRGSVPPGARVEALGHGSLAPVGSGVLGRVLDGLGRPIDGGQPLWNVSQVPVHAEPPHALTRPSIAAPMPCGVRAIDGMLTLARGQRVGILAGSGVGKSTLLGMLARGAEADVTVIALIGERGREVRDFLEHDLGPEAMPHTVVVASTGDNPAAMRLSAANAATAIAEGFRDQGLNVLLLFDSLTRVAMAQREIGLAAGEPPATRGYPPSVFSILPHLMERAGPGPTGSITAVYTVLADGEEMDDPIVDLARATLDGHIVLKRSLAGAGHYPPIDILGSASRLMTRVASDEHASAANALRQLLAAYEDARDLINIGGYVTGADPVVDAAIALRPDLDAFLRQGPNEATPFEDAEAWIQQLGQRAGGAPANSSGGVPAIAPGQEVTPNGALPATT